MSGIGHTRQLWTKRSSSRNLILPMVVSHRDTLWAQRRTRKEVWHPNRLDPCEQRETETHQNDSPELVAVAQTPDEKQEPLSAVHSPQSVALPLVDMTVNTSTDTRVCPGPPRHCTPERTYRSTCRGGLRRSPERGGRSRSRVGVACEDHPPSYHTRMSRN